MTTITLTANPAGTPAPYVEVVVDDHPVDSASCTVWRVQNNRLFRVRGLVRVPTTGVLSQLDVEAPFDREAIYRVQYFDDEGEFLEWSSDETVTLTGVEPGWAWVHDPFDPSTSLQVRFEASTAGDIFKNSAVDQMMVPGRSVGVVFAGTRSGVQGVVLDIWLASNADADRLDAMLGVYNERRPPILCVRTHPAMRLPGTLFATTGRTMYRPYGARRGSEAAEWSMVVDEVAPPVEAAVTALLDYADFTAFYTDNGGDYAAFTAAYVDYTEAQLDYSIAGYAP